MKACFAVVLVTLALLAPASAADVDFAWVSQFGSSVGDEALSLASDGNAAYIAGATNGVLPGQVSAGNLDAFLTKYDADGNAVWTRQFGTPGFDNARGVSAGAGSVYAAGNNFTPPSFASFLRRYDPDGGLVWERQFTTPVLAAVVATADAVYLGGAATSNARPLVARHDLVGNEIWTRIFETPARGGVAAIAVHESGVYVAGGVDGALLGETSLGLPDSFIRKYDAQGNVLWSHQFGSASFDGVFGIATDATGVYVVGDVGLTLPGQTSAGADDAFIRKYDHSGNELWTRQFGSAFSDDARAVTVTDIGIVVVGQVGAALPGEADAGGTDAFVRVYDEDGQEQATHQFGTSAFDAAQAVAGSAAGTFVSGITEAGLLGQSPLGGRDGFLALLGPAEVPFALLGGRLTLAPHGPSGEETVVLHGSFELGSGSDGIDPVGEEVVVEIGDFEVSLPPGSFKAAGSGYRFHDADEERGLTIRIDPKRSGGFDVHVVAVGNVTAAVAETLPVRLRVGDDAGEASLAVKLAAD